MSATKVQSKAFLNSSWSSPLSVTMDSNITAGSTCVAGFIMSGNGTTRVTGVTIAGTAATKIYDTDSGANTSHIEFWLAENVAGGSTAVSITAGAGSGFRINGSIDEWTGLATSPFDTFGETVNGSPGTSVTATANAQTSTADAVLYATIATTNNNLTTLTGPTGYTNLWSKLDGGAGHGGAGYYKIETVAETEAAAFSGFSSTTNMAAIITLKVGPPTPNITGGTAAPVHLSTGNTLTGINFEASQGTGGAVIGGVGQTETAWGATSITYTADRGTNLNGVAVNAVVTNNSGVASSNYALTGFQPPAGYYSVTLTSVNSTAAYRITAAGDLAIGNQLEWDNAFVTIYADGTYVADQTVTSFNVRVGVTTDGWGALAVQSVNGSSGGTNHTTGATLVKAFNKRVGSGF